MAACRVLSCSHKVTQTEPPRDAGCKGVVVMYIVGRRLQSCDSQANAAKAVGETSSCPLPRFASIGISVRVSTAGKAFQMV